MLAEYTITMPKASSATHTQIRAWSKPSTREGVLVTVGGSLGTESAFGRNIGARIPLTDVPDALVNLFTAYEQHGQEDENFRAFTLRNSNDDLTAWLRGEAVTG